MEGQQMLDFGQEAVYILHSLVVLIVWYLSPFYIHSSLHLHLAPIIEPVVVTHCLGPSLLPGMVARADPRSGCAILPLSETCPWRKSGLYLAARCIHSCR